MFFTLKILSLIKSFVILLLPFSMRLLIHPASLVLKIGNLVGINTVIYTFSLEVACIMKNEEGLGEVRLEVGSDFSFVVALKVTIFFELINLNISFGELILILGFLVGIDQIVGRLQPPAFVGGGLKFGESFNFFFNMIVDMGKRRGLGSQTRILSDEVFLYGGFGFDLDYLDIHDAIYILLLDCLIAVTHISHSLIILIIQCTSEINQKINQHQAIDRGFKRAKLCLKQTEQTIFILETVLHLLSQSLCNIIIDMKKEQAKEYFQQLKKLDKAKNTRLAEVINIITGGSIPLQKAQNFIQQTASNEFGVYSEIYEYLQLPDWRQLQFDQIYLIIKCLKDYLKKTKMRQETQDNSQIDIKLQLGSQLESRLQNNTLQQIVDQLNEKQGLVNTEQSQQSAYEEKWKHAKFKVIKKLLIIFDYLRKSMCIEGQTFEKNQKICEKLDLNMFMKYAKMFQLGTVFKIEKMIKSFKENAINQLWIDFDRFVSANFQIVGFRQTIPNKDKYLRLRALIDLLSSQKIKKMLNIRGKKALATIVEGHTGTYKQDILDYLKHKYEERKVKLDNKWKGKKINTEGDESRIFAFQKNHSNNLSKVQSAKSVSKRAKTLQAVSIYDELKLPKLRVKESRDQSIYKSLKLLDLKNEESRVRQLVNIQQDEYYLKEYLRKEQVQRQINKRKCKKIVQLPPMKFT